MKQLDVGKIKREKVQTSSYKIVTGDTLDSMVTGINDMYCILESC